MLALFLQLLLVKHSYPGIVVHLNGGWCSFNNDILLGMVDVVVVVVVVKPLIVYHTEPRDGIYYGGGAAIIYIFYSG